MRHRWRAAAALLVVILAATAVAVVARARAAGADPAEEARQAATAFLDTYVVGQEHAKRSLAVAVYNHYKRVNAGVNAAGEGSSRRSAEVSSSCRRRSSARVRSRWANSSCMRRSFSTRRCSARAASSLA